MPHQHHPAALIFAASRWEFGIIEFCEARRTSYPAHFVISSQTDVISPILGMNGSSCDARVLLCILCTAQRLVFTIQRVTHLCPGSWPRFYEGMLYQSSIHIPQEVRHRILNQRCALSQVHGRVKLLWQSFPFRISLPLFFRRVETLKIDPSVGISSDLSLSVVTEGGSRIVPNEHQCSRVKYSPAVILAFLPSFRICHGGCTQGWLSL